MSLKSAPYYWIECDHPGCGARSTEGGDYAAWADHGAAYDEATSRDWYCPSGGPDLCEEHAPPFCCNCSEVATTEHEGDDYCDDCLADELAPDVYETAAQRIATPDRSFISAEDVIADPTTEETP